MTILPRSQVRAAVERALNLDPDRRIETAVEVAAYVLALPREAVLEVVSEQLESAE